MPHKIKIEIDKSSLRRAQSMFNDLETAAPRVLTRAINKTLTGVRTDITKEVGDILNVKKKRIRDSIRLRKASINTQTGIVEIGGVRIPLVFFAATHKRTWPGARAKIEKRGARKTWQHAFIVFEKRRGRLAVFWRKKEGGKRVGRKPIIEVFGPRITDYLEREEVMAPVQRKAGERLEKNLAHEIDYYLQKHRG